jgi:uncharacterized protein
MNGDGYLHPVPEPTPESKPYWEGLREGKFMVQRCTACGRLRHYPRPLCSGCFSFDAEWTTLSGRGIVHSWTICHHAFLPAFKSWLPYIVAIADLEGGVRVNLQLAGPAEQEIRIGMLVEIAYQVVNDDFTLPVLIKTRQAPDITHPEGS